MEGNIILFSEDEYKKFKTDLENGYTDLGRQVQQIAAALKEFTGKDFTKGVNTDQERLKAVETALGSAQAALREATDKIAAHDKEVGKIGALETSVNANLSDQIRVRDALEEKGVIAHIDYAVTGGIK